MELQVNKFSVEFEVCCPIFIKTIESKIWSIGKLEDGFKFITMVSEEKNLYHKESEMFVEAVVVDEIKFCPFCGEKLNYTITQG